MADWVVTDGPLWQKLSEVRRTEISTWLRMNGVSPRLVPVDATVMVAESAPGIWEIRYEEYPTDRDGNIVFIDTDSAGIQARSVPLVIDPPMHWLIPAVPTS
jgi:hypothetical protein